MRRLDSDPITVGDLRLLVRDLRLRADREGGRASVHLGILARVIGRWLVRAPAPTPVPTKGPCPYGNESCDAKAIVCKDCNRNIMRAREQEWEQVLPACIYGNGCMGPTAISKGGGKAVVICAQCVSAGTVSEGGAEISPTILQIAAASTDPRRDLAKALDMAHHWHLRAVRAETALIERDKP